MTHRYCKTKLLLPLLPLFALHTLLLDVDVGKSHVLNLHRFTQVTTSVPCDQGTLSGSLQYIQHTKRSGGEDKSSQKKKTTNVTMTRLVRAWRSALCRSPTCECWPGQESLIRGVESCLRPADIRPEQARRETYLIPLAPVQRDVRLG